ncbi:MAG TPA: phage antirepressor KilAC domain-containing protein [Thermomonas sp.]|nr:phage antirepressor KilAC domain-containing protein [Thermomonas sp.]
MNAPARSDALVIGTIAIRTDEEGRFNFNDLHRAGGGHARHRPGQWLRSTQVKELVAELDSDAQICALAVQRGGAGSGSYGRRELALAYSAWISPAFHVRVLRAADAVFTGQVQASQRDVQAALQDPTTLRALLLEQTGSRLRLEAEAERLQDEVDRTAPRAAAYDRIAGHRDAMSLTAAGKVLGIAQHQFIAWLSQLRWIYRAADHGSWLGHADRIKRGYLTHRMCPIERSAGFIQTKPQVLVTASGIAKLAALLEQASHETPVPLHAQEN